jgi:NTP pyrophosphatase (non-canonical NTP hydrolase)
MGLKEKQNQVDKWVSQFEKPYFSPLSIIAQISEEVGELSRVVNNIYGDRVKKIQDPKSEIGSEICDTFFALICLANSHNIDLDEMWDKTISARFERDKERYKKLNQD